MAVRWHVERADGRYWTRGELDDLIADDCRDKGYRTLPRWWFNVVDENGVLMLVDTLMGIHGVTEDVDMRVVWD